MNARRVKLSLSFVACIAGCLAAWGSTVPAAAQPAADPRCTRICVALIQAVGDEVKEQISMDCIQTTGKCRADGYFQTINERIAVVIDGQLADQTLTLQIQAGDAYFAPAGQNTLTIPLTAGIPQQAAQFIVYRRSDANSSDPLAVTVMVQRLVD